MNRWMGIAMSAALTVSSASLAEIIVDYTVDAGGENENPLNGMMARATFGIDGTQLTILLENNSLGVPMDAEDSDSLLVSLGFNLMDNISILSGDSAVIGPGSYGVGLWDGMMEGESVAHEWLWTNQYGGDLMEDCAQIISTSNGQGGGDTWSFNGDPDPNVDGPFGGMAADPPFIEIPGNQPAVADSIFFTLTLSDTLSDEQLELIALGSMVEYGSDFQYLTVPAPPALSVLLLALLHRRRRR